MMVNGTTILWIPRYGSFPTEVRTHIQTKRTHLQYGHLFLCSCTSCGPVDVLLASFTATFYVQLPTARAAAAPVVTMVGSVVRRRINGVKTAFTGIILGQGVLIHCSNVASVPTELRLQYVNQSSM